jgi:hypothetical protein
MIYIFENIKNFDIYIFIKFSKLYFKKSLLIYILWHSYHLFMNIIVIRFYGGF